MSEQVFLNGRVVLQQGDCLDVLRGLPENSLDAAVMDPPYHLTSIVKRFGAEGSAPAQEGTDGAFRRASAGFMGQGWDGGDIAFRVETWREVLRVLKPGAYLLAFASTRGFGRMSVAIEDAGFVSHPLIASLVEHADAAGFMASLSSSQIDMLLQLLAHRELGGMLGWVFGSGFPKATRIKAEGYEDFRYGGQALKPAIEPIFMGQKPFEKGLSGTENILKWGTGALNVGGCRVGRYQREVQVRDIKRMHGGSYANQDKRGGDIVGKKTETGRWPANVIHDGSDEVVVSFPDGLTSGTGAVKRASSADEGGNAGSAYGAESRTSGTPMISYGDSGSASRFFYSSKADSEDRVGSRHPTVKPVDLMRYLVRLVTPTGGRVLDCFAGTGTTGEAAWREGCSALLIEREASYCADIAARMELVLAGRSTKRAEIEKRKSAAVDHGPLFGGADTSPMTDGRSTDGSPTRKAVGHDL